MGKVGTTALLASANPAGRVAGPRVRIGACLVHADLDRVVTPDREVALEPKAMAVLMYLAHHPGQVISAGELIEAVWQGRPMGDNPVYHCIAQLRRALGDHSRAPTYIATVPTKGYRLIAPVETLDPLPPPMELHEAPPVREEAAADAPPARRRRTAMRVVALLLVVLLLVLLAALAWLLASRRGAPPPSSAQVALALAASGDILTRMKHRCWRRSKELATLQELTI
jgi:DNA-binding winged helix-turn-helix (wHTH) protein